MSSKIGPIDFSQDGPLYRKLQTAIRFAIDRSILKPDDALPPERDLAEAYSLSRITVRKAIGGLVEEGLLVRRQGAGTFVRGRVEKTFSKLSSFTEDLAGRGQSVDSRWLKRERGVVRPDEALAFGLAPGSVVYRFHRVRLADGVPLALEQTCVPGFGLPHADSVTHSLYAALEQRGNRPVRGLQRLRAIALDADRATLLDMEPGAAALLIERRGFLADGRLIEVTSSWYRGDAYDFVAEM